MVEVFLRISSIPLSNLGTTGLRLCFFADDIGMLASSSLDFQCALGQFAGECEAAGMRICTESKAMVLD